MAIQSTRLRYVSAKSADTLTQFVSALPFKVEIKGGPVLKRGRWHLFFVLPEVAGLDFQSVNLTD